MPFLLIFVMCSINNYRGDLTEIRWGVGGDSNTASASSGGCLVEAPTHYDYIKRKESCQGKKY